MIKGKNIIILLIAALLLLAGIYAAVTLDLGKAPGEDSPESGDPSEAVTLSDYAGADVAKIAVKLAGESYVLYLENDAWQLGESFGAKLDQNKVKALAENAADIRADKIIEENAGDLTAYGLTDDPMALTVTHGGLKTTYLCGGKTPSSGRRYFMREDLNTVYAVSESTINRLFAPSFDYRDKTVLSFEPDTVTEIKILKNGALSAIKRLADEVSSSGYTLYEWEITSPFHKYADTQTVQDAYLAPLSSLTVKKFVSDNARADDYGLARPLAEITLINDENKSDKILVGNKAEEGYYISRGGEKRVYLVPAQSLSFIDADIFNAASGLLYTPMITDVEKIEITSGNARHEILIADGSYTLDGESVEESLFKKQVYQSVIGLIMDGYEPVGARGKTAAVISYTLTDKSQTKLEFEEYDDRNYAVYSNGALQGIILKKKVGALLKSLSDING